MLRQKNKICVGMLLWTAMGVVQAEDVSPGVVLDSLNPIAAPVVVQPSVAQPIENQNITEAQTDAIPIPPSPTYSQTVYVTRFMVTGNRIVSGAEIEKVLQPWTGREVSLDEIYQAADAVSRYYAKLGWQLGSATVPAQKIEDGTVRLEVFEGKIGEIRHEEGKADYTATELFSWIPRTAPNLIYQQKDVEHGMILLNRLPGLTARLVIRPGVEYGTSDLVLKTEEDRFRGTVFADNYGRKDIGLNRFGVALQGNHVWFAGDQVSVTALQSSGDLLRYGGLGYAFGVNKRGTRVSFDASRAGYEVSNPIFGALGLGGLVHDYRATISHPVYLSNESSLVLSGGVAHQRGETEILGTRQVTSDLTLANINFDWQRRSRLGAISQLELNLAGNGRERDALQNDRQRVRTQLSLDHLQPLWFGLQTQIRMNGSWSPDALVDTQVVAMGGPGSVRGYGISALRGDQHYFGSLALQYPIRFTRSIIMPSVFVDGGGVRRVQPAVGQTKRDNITSAGVGLVFNFNNHLQIQTEWARPIDGGCPVGQKHGCQQIWYRMQYAF